MEQTLSGYIRQHLAEIEQRLEFGTRQETIVAELVGLGYTTTIQSFRNTLSRARTWAKTKQAPTTRQEVKQPQKPASETGKEDVTRSASFNFKGTKNFNEDDLV